MKYQKSLYSKFQIAHKLSNKRKDYSYKLNTLWEITNFVIILQEFNLNLADHIVLLVNFADIIQKLSFILSESDLDESEDTHGQRELDSLM